MIRHPLAPWLLALALAVPLRMALGALRILPARDAHLDVALAHLEARRIPAQPLWIVLGNSLFDHGLPTTRALEADVSALQGRPTQVARITRGYLSLAAMEPALNALVALDPEVVLLQVDLVLPLRIPTEAEAAPLRGDPLALKLLSWRSIEAGGRSWRLAEHLAGHLAARGSRLILVDVPLSETLTAGRPASVVARREAAIAELAGWRSTRVIRPDGPLPDALYTDFAHLAPDGRARFTAWLWRELG